MALLDDLRAASHDTAAAEPPFFLLKRALPLLVPRLEVTKMEVFSEGRVTVRVRSPLGGQGRFYGVAILDKVGTSLPDGRRKIMLAAGKYRDEGDAMLVDHPFEGYIEPTPGGMACWMAGVLLTRSLYDGLPRSSF